MNKSTTVGAMMCGALLTTLTTSTREPVSRDEIVNSFQEVFDVRPGQLLKNRNCICAGGAFHGHVRGICAESLSNVHASLSASVLAFSEILSQALAPMPDALVLGQ